MWELFNSALFNRFFFFSRDLNKKKDEVASTTAVQEPSWIPEGTESRHPRQSVQPPGYMSRRAQVHITEYIQMTVWLFLRLFLLNSLHFSSGSSHLWRRIMWCECCSWITLFRRQLWHCGSKKTAKSKSPPMFPSSQDKGQNQGFYF